MNTTRKRKGYALIYFRDKKPLKRTYDSAAKAFYDHQDQGCVLVELFDEMGFLLSFVRFSESVPVEHEPSQNSNN